MARSLSQMILAGGGQPAGGQNILTQVQQGLQTGIQLASLAQGLDTQREEAKVTRAKVVQSKFNAGVSIVAFASKGKTDAEVKRRFNLGVDRFKDVFTFSPEAQELLISRVENRQAILTTAGKIAKGDFGEVTPKLMEQFIEFSASGEKAEQMINTTLQLAKFRKAEVAAEARAKTTEARREVKSEVRIDRARLELSKRVEKTGIDDTSQAFRNIQDVLTTIGKGKDIPGFGIQTLLQGNIPILGANPARFLDTKEGRALRQGVATLRNLILKQRSGAAITPQEATRLSEELGIGAFRSDEDLRRGLGFALSLVKSKLQNIEAGSFPEAISSFQEQGGLSTQDPIFQFAEGERIAEAPGAAPQAPSDPKAELIAFLRNKGIKVAQTAQALAAKIEIELSQAELQGLTLEKTTADTTPPIAAPGTLPPEFP